MLNYNQWERLLKLGYKITNPTISKSPLTIYKLAKEPYPQLENMNGNVLEGHIRSLYLDDDIPWQRSE